MMKWAILLRNVRRARVTSAATLVLAEDILNKQFLSCILVHIINSSNTLYLHDCSTTGIGERKELCGMPSVTLPESWAMAPLIKPKLQR